MIQRKQKKDEEICNVITWAERYEGNLINETLIKFETIKRETYNPTYYDLPREVDLVLVFSNKSQIIVFHELTEQVSHNFTVLDWDQIAKSNVYEKLYKTRIAGAASVQEYQKCMKEQC